MRWQFCFLACATFAVLAAPSAPTKNHIAALYERDSDWDGVLDSVMGDDLRLDPTSSQPKGFLSRARGGDPGRLDDPTGSFLIFDGPRAAFLLRVPQWRRVDGFGFFALEAKGGSRAGASLTFAKSGARPLSIDLARRVIAARNGMQHVYYETSRPKLALSGGEFRLVYENPDFASAFVAEIRVDGLGPKIEGSTACAPCEPRLLWWQQAGAPGGATLHSMLVGIARSGDAKADVAPAWLVVPAGRQAARPVPLVVVVQDPGDPLNALEALGMAGRPEYAVAPALARSGNAVLVVELAGGDARGRDAHLERLGAVIREVMNGSFARHARVRLDARRLGILGSGEGAGLARALARRDPRFRRVAILDAGAFGIPDRDRIAALGGFFAGVRAPQAVAAEREVSQARARMAAYAREFEAAAADAPPARADR